MKLFTLTIIAAFLFAILFASGCTLHFKATELEVDSEAAHTYKFDRLGFTHDTDQDVFGNSRYLWQGSRWYFLS